MPAEGSAQAGFVQESERDVQKTNVRISCKFSVLCHYLLKLRLVIWLKNHTSLAFLKKQIKTKKHPTLPVPSPSPRNLIFPPHTQC